MTFDRCSSDESRDSFSPSKTLYMSSIGIGDVDVAIIYYGLWVVSAVSEWGWIDGVLDIPHPIGSNEGSVDSLLTYSILEKLIIKCVAGSPGYKRDLRLNIYYQ